MPVPIFFGRVLPGGLLILDRKQDYGRHLRSLSGRFVEIVIRKRRTQRSSQQNRWWWGTAVPLIADELGYDKHEHDDVHYALVAKCFGTHYDEKLGTEMPNARSSRLSTAEFSALMEWAVRWAAIEHHIEIPLPNEVDIPDVPEPSARDLQTAYQRVSKVAHAAR